MKRSVKKYDVVETHIAIGVDTASAVARINAVLVHTSLVTSAFAVICE